MAYIEVASYSQRAAAVSGVTGSSQYTGKFCWFQMAFQVPLDSFATSSPLSVQVRVTQSLCISKVCALCLALGVKCEGDAD